MTVSQSHIPVIDFEKLSLDRKDGDIIDEDLQDVGIQIKAAFQSVGFCYLKNFGVNHDIIDKYFTASLDFFLLPIEKKTKSARLADCFFGWSSLEKERTNPERPGDFKEAFDYLSDNDPIVWPSEEFKEITVAMFSFCSKLSYRICDALSVGLGLGNTFLRDAHKLVGKEGNSSILRTLYYPPIPEGSAIRPGQIRLGEHSDYGSLTLLFQDDIGGLEVEVPGVGFVPATPIPDTVVMNIGELMQRWTSDSLIATKHRVLIPEVELNRKCHRQSVAFFVQPDDNCIIKCLDGSNKYAPISSVEHLTQRLSDTYKI